MLTRFHISPFLYILFHRRLYELHKHRRIFFPKSPPQVTNTQTMSDLTMFKLNDPSATPPKKEVIGTYEWC